MVRKKTNPASIRFDEEKLEFLMQQEGISSKQQAVDYLLEKYWWERHIGIPPTNERNGGKAKIDQDHGKKYPKKREIGDTAQAVMLMMSDEDAARIMQLQSEIEKGPPKEYSAVGRKSYLYDRNKEINEIKAKYGNE